jgi:hypothetical protein
VNYGQQLPSIALCQHRRVLTPEFSQLIDIDVAQRARKVRQQIVVKQIGRSVESLGKCFGNECFTLRVADSPRGYKF